MATARDEFAKRISTLALVHAGVRRASHSWPQLNRSQGVSESASCWRRSGLAHPMKALAHCLKAMPSSPILTEAGRELYDRAAQILADGEAVENEAIAHSAAPRGNVRLAAPISFGVLRIAPTLPEFLTLYPDVTIDLNLSDTYVDLVGEGYDAAIRIASLPDSSLMGRTLAPVYRYLVAAPSYLSKYGRPSHPLRLSEHRCIAYVSTPGETWHFSNAAGETATVRPVGPFRVNNGDAILPALTAGIGVGILPEFIVHEALTDGRLEIVLPEWTSSSGSVHWLTPPGGRRPKRVEVLGDFFQRRLSSKRLSGKD